MSRYGLFLFVLSGLVACGNVSDDANRLANAGAAPALQAFLGGAGNATEGYHRATTVRP
jgi:hypothetical protein